MKKLFSLISTVLLLPLVVPTTANAFFPHNDEVPANKEIIVLLHGLGRNTTSMWLLASRLEDAGHGGDESPSGNQTYG